MSKQFKKLAFRGGEGVSNSKGQGPPKASDTDAEIARKLNEELNAGYVEDNDHDSQQDGSSGFPKEIQTAVEYIQRYADAVLNRMCYKCELPLIHEFNIHDWTTRWQNASTESACGCKCECGATTCLGCGKKAQRGNPKYVLEYDGLRLDYCCSKGGAFIAWVVLSMYDDMELNVQAMSEQNQTARRRVQALVPRGSLAGNGVGYGRNMHHMPYHQPQVLNFKPIDAETDSTTKWIISLLIELLPRRNETTAKVNPIIGSMFELSLLQDRVAALLRNDSLRDIDKRPHLYFATFELVGRLGAHPDLSYLVLEDRFKKKQSAGLQAIATAGGRGKGKAIANDFLIVASRRQGMAPSLVSCLCNLATQSKAFLGGSSIAAADKDILEIAQRVNKVYTRLGGDAASISTITTWKEYHRKHCLIRKANVAQYLCPRMSKLAMGIQNSAKGRNNRLFAETSEMTTSLPEGIFVMVDENRLDVMKALIVGPNDTPYEGGLFEFDIVCGPLYPQQPPAVWFVTTGQGTVSFNPNLYAGGKVCLSLLGTWEGSAETKWQPGRSTIASVLVSIQSMILWKWPMENEPGYENAHTTKGGLAQCLSYNREKRADTLKHATMDWLTRKEMRDGLWRDVVRDYFRFCGRKVLESARKSEGEKAGTLFGAKRVFGKGMVDELEKAIEGIRSDRPVGIGAK